MARLKHIVNERLDKHHKAIIEYIKINPAGVTENQVVKAMDTAKPKVCSKMTTLRKLDELIEKEEIKDLLEESETDSRFHNYVINDKNEFNRIYGELSKIESIIDKMKKNTNIKETRDRMRKEGEEKRLNPFNELRANFFFPYSESFNIMLRILLLLTYEKIHSDKELQVLYTKHIELMLKLGQFRYEMKDMIRRLKIDTQNLINIDMRIRNRAKDYGVDTSLTIDMISKLEYFMKEFLDDANFIY